MSLISSFVAMQPVNEYCLHYFYFLEFIELLLVGPVILSVQCSCQKVALAVTRLRRSIYIHLVGDVLTSLVNLLSTCSVLNQENQSFLC